MRIPKKIARIATRVQQLIAVVNRIGSGSYSIPIQTDTGRLRDERRKKAARVARLMSETFNEAELNELCANFGIFYEDIEGGSRRERIIHLVHHFYRHNTLDVLIHWLSGQRPHVDWPKGVEDNG